MANPLGALGSVPIMQVIQDTLQRSADINRTNATTQILGQQSQMMQQQIESERRFNAGLANLANAQQAKANSEVGFSPSPEFAVFGNTSMGKPIMDGYRTESQAEQQNRQLAKLALDSGSQARYEHYQKLADEAGGRARQWYSQGLQLSRDQQKEGASLAGSYNPDGSNLDQVVSGMNDLDPRALQGPQFDRNLDGSIKAGDRTTAAFANIANAKMTRSEQIRAKQEADKLKQEAIRNEANDRKEKEKEKMDDARLAAMQHGMRVADARLAIALGETKGSVPEKDQDKHGEEYLATLSPSMAAEVKAIAEGRQNISAMGYRGAARSAMMERVNQYDPNFDQTTWSARNAMAREFASGQSSKNITAINTGIGHLGTMNELAKAMNNRDMPLVNKLVNNIATNFGDPRINNYQLAATAVSDEMMRIFRQVGASDTEAARWEKAFKSDLSTGQLQNSMGVAVKLLGSRAEALGDRYRDVMGDTVKQPTVVNQRSQDVLKQLGVKLNVGGPPKPVIPTKAATRDQVTARGVAYEPDKYEYGIDESGNLMRRKK